MKNRLVKRHMLPTWRHAEALWRNFIDTLARHPRRLAGSGAVCLVLLYLVMTTTLPMALAPSAPRLAGFLNSRDPTFLMQAAEQARRAFLGLDSEASKAQQAAETQPSSPSPEGVPSGRPNLGPVDTIARLPEAPAMAATSLPLDPDTQALRDDVVRRADAVIAVDPLNPVPFRIKAEVMETGQQRHLLLIEAAKRSRRDPQTLLLLIQDDLNSNRYDSALEQTDILLRSEPRLAEQLFAIMSPLAEDAERLPILVNWLARSPDWRSGFFLYLQRTMTRADTLFNLMTALEQAGQPPAQKDINAYLSFLLNKGFPTYAYNVWVQTLPRDVFAQVGFLNNPSFEREPTGSPFDWRMSTPRNATGEFVTPRDMPGQRTFHVTFGAGRVRFPDLSQTLALPPGRYRLEGRLKGTVIGKQGLVWQMQCYYRRSPALGQTQPLLGQTQSWRMFEFEFEVPNIPECLAQTLILFHDSRSASEELVSGEVWFDDLELRRITQ